jgi:hypothetical protein
MYRQQASFSPSLSKFFFFSPSLSKFIFLSPSFYSSWKYHALTLRTATPHLGPPSVAHTPKSLPYSTRNEKSKHLLCRKQASFNPYIIEFLLFLCPSLILKMRTQRVSSVVSRPPSTPSSLLQKSHLCIPSQKLRGLSPNSYIYVSVTDLYIPRICPHI